MKKKLIGLLIALIFVPTFTTNAKTININPEKKCEEKEEHKKEDKEDKCKKEHKEHKDKKHKKEDKDCKKDIDISKDLPKVKVKVKGNEANSSICNYKWKSEKTEDKEVKKELMKLKEAEKKLKPVKGKVGDEIVFEFSEKPSDLCVEIVGQKPETKVKDCKMTIPECKGKSLMNVKAKYKNGEISYVFLVEIV